MSIELRQMLAHTLRIVALAITLLVFYGWFSAQASYVQLYPNMAPTQFNTTICFALAIIGIGILKRPPGQYYLWEKLGLVLALVIASITLLQDVLSLSFGIDTLLWNDPFIIEKSPTPGRMSPLSGLCFIATALAGLIASSPKYRNELGMKMFLALMFFVFFISGSVFLGYLLQLTVLSLSENVTEQSIITAVLFQLLVASTVLYHSIDKSFVYIRHYFNATNVLLVSFLWMVYLAMTI